MDNQNQNPQDREQAEIDQRAKETDAEVRGVIDQILKKPVETMTIDDKRFLQARSSYMSRGERKDYEDVLNEKLDLKDGPKLEDLTREELNSIAKQLGIKDPDKFGNKNEVIAKIKEAQKEE